MFHFNFEFGICYDITYLASLFLACCVNNPIHFSRMLIYLWSKYIAFKTTHFHMEETEHQGLRQIETMRQTTCKQSTLM